MTRHVHRPDADGRCLQCGRELRYVPEEPNRRGYWVPSVPVATAKPRGSR